MKKIIIFFLLIPYFSFSQENMFFNYSGFNSPPFSALKPGVEGFCSPAYARRNLQYPAVYDGDSLFTKYPYFEDEEINKPKDKLLTSLFPFTVLLASVALNVGMREGIYRNNQQDNWWGTVNGALTLGLAGAITGAGISYGIYIISDENFDEINILLGAFLGWAGGITMAFFPPFKQEFRENPYLYYTKGSPKNKYYILCIEGCRV
jgi:hypothetical protein